MATLYDKNGNAVEFPDAEVEARLAETWRIQQREQPRYFRENPAERTPRSKAVAGAELVRMRAKRRAARLHELGRLATGEADAFVQAEVARVKAEFLASGDPKRQAIGGAL